jgi:hypothetical protein
MHPFIAISSHISCETYAPNSSGDCFSLPVHSADKKHPVVDSAISESPYPGDLN